MQQTLPNEQEPLRRPPYKEQTDPSVQIPDSPLDVVQEIEFWTRGFIKSPHAFAEGNTLLKRPTNNRFSAWFLTFSVSPIFKIHLIIIWNWKKKITKIATHF